MKKKLLFLVLIAGFCHAQDVNIPNANFKNRLLSASPTNTIAKNLEGSYFKIDANADGQIQVSEALEVSDLDISTNPLTPGLGIASIEGIASFTNLVKLNAKQNALVASPNILDLTMLNQLNYVNVTNTAVGTLNLGLKNNLETLMVGSSCSMIQYDSPTATLKSFTGKANAFQSINYLKRIALEELHVTDGIIFPFESLKYHTNLKLLDFDIDMYNVSEINFTNYNPLDNPIYPNNIKTLITPVLFQGLPIALFQNLESLTFNSISGTQYTTQIFQPSNFPNLKYLELRRGTGLNNSNPIQVLDLTPLIHLESFVTSGGGPLNDGHETLNTVIFGSKPMLKNVDIDRIPFENVDLSNCPNVEYLKIGSGDSWQTYPVNLTVTLAAENQLKQFNMDGMLGGNTAMKVSVINMEGTQTLEKVRFVQCNFQNNLIIDSPTFTAFESHLAYYHGLTFGDLPIFTDFWIEGWLLDDPDDIADLSLDLSGCTSLGASQNPLSIAYKKLRYINLKNGNNEASVDITNDYDDPGLTVCIDDSDFDNDIFPNGLMGWELPDQGVVVTSYCSLTPNGTFNTLKGNITFDANANGYDASDDAIPEIQIHSIAGSANETTFSDFSGNYTQYLGLGNFNVSTVFENPGYFTASPATFAVPFPDSFNNVQTQDISVVANGVHNDLEITVIPITQARPGFEARYKILYKNKGTSVQSGSVSFAYDDSKMNFLSATQTANSQSTGNLGWNFENLNPFEKRQIILTMLLNTPQDEVPVNNGELLTYNANVNAGADETPANNQFLLNQNVVNSYDPNDKVCLEGSVIGTAKVGDYVNYIIRFENVGTADAVNVVVRDMINLAKFDINTIQPVDASHAYRMTVRGNKVEFFFENILLPGLPSELRYGYVVFKIRTKSNLVAGNTFSNSANIYFDYNAPIATNNFTTSVQNLALGSFNANSWEIWPNPVKDHLFFAPTAEIAKIEIYDLSGRIIRASQILENTLDLTGLSAGTYILKAYGPNSVQSFKIVKQ